MNYSGPVPGAVNLLMVNYGGAGPGFCKLTHGELRWGGGPGAVNLLIVNYGGPVTGHGLLLDDVDELEGAAEGGVRVGPLGALEMSHLQHIVILQGEEREERRVLKPYRQHWHGRDTPAVWTDPHLCFIQSIKASVY